MCWKTLLFNCSSTYQKSAVECFFKLQNARTLCHSNKVVIIGRRMRFYWLSIYELYWKVAYYIERSKQVCMCSGARRRSLLLFPARRSSLFLLPISSTRENVTFDSFLLFALKTCTLVTRSNEPFIKVFALKKKCRDFPVELQRIRFLHKLTAA